MVKHSSPISNPDSNVFVKILEKLHFMTLLRRAGFTKEEDARLRKEREKEIAEKERIRKAEENDGCIGPVRPLPEKPHRSYLGVLDMMISALSLPLMGSNPGQVFNSALSDLLPCRRSAMYAFLRRADHSWTRLTRLLALAAVRFIRTLGGRGTDECIAIDDSNLYRTCAKKVENCSRIHNHATNKVCKGFQVLLAVWTDGISIIPFWMQVMASLFQLDDDRGDSLIKAGKKKKAASEPPCKNPKKKQHIDGRSAGALNRKNAFLSKPRMFVKMIDSAATVFGKALKYVLTDSWYGYEPLLKEIMARGLNCICMLKNDARVYTRLDRKGRLLRCGTLAWLLGSRNKRRASKEDRAIAGWETVWMHGVDEQPEDGILVKLVYLVNRSTGNTDVVLASTDVTLSAERIVQLYARRWMIEVGFHSMKSFLGLAKGTFSPDFDSVTAAACLAAMRETLLEVKRRSECDGRGEGDLMRAVQEQLYEITVTQAVEALLAAVVRIRERLTEEGCIAKGKEALADRIFESELGEWMNRQNRYIRGLFDGAAKKMRSQLRSLRRQKAQKAA